MTLFDLIAIVVVLLSVLAGFSNGAVREIVGLCAFGLAVAGAVLLLPFSRPLARAVVHHPGWASSGVAVLVAFLMIYIALQIGGRFITARFRNAGLLGGVDRVLGGGFGLARAGVLLGVFNLVYQTATPAELRPRWVERAALFPVAAAAGRTLQIVAPRGTAVAGRLAPSLKSALVEPDEGAGFALGGDAAQTNTEAERESALAKAAGPKPRSARRAAPTRSSRDGLDVVLEPPR